MNKNFIFLYILLYIFYIIIPYDICGFEIINCKYSNYFGDLYSGNLKYILDIKHNFNSTYLIYLYNIIPITFLLYIFIKRGLSYSLDIYSYVAIAVLVITCIIMLGLDIYKVILFINENGYNRDALFINFGSIRKTHIIILIICSLSIHYINRFFGLISFILILIYSILTQSRYEIFLFTILYFCIYIELSIRNWKIILISALTVIIVIFYRFILKNQNIIVNLFFEPISISVSSYILNSNLKYDNFLIDNMKYILSDFLYLNEVLIDYYDGPLKKMAISGFDTLKIYPLALSFYLLLLVICRYFSKNKFENLYIISALYICLIPYRSHVVHNMGFIVKLFILVMLLRGLCKIIILRLKADWVTNFFNMRLVNTLKK